MRTTGRTARRTRSALLTVCVAATALVASALAASLASANPAPPPASFTLAGAGFGHGVGMSQYGALAMAKAGLDASSIVTHYYQGTNVTPVAAPPATVTAPARRHGMAMVTAGVARLTGW